MAITTTAAILAATAAVATAGGAVISSNAAKSAAKTQAAAADQATGLQRDIYNQNREDLAPWRQAGTGALQMLANSLGLNGPAGNESAKATFEKSPGYDFAFSEGQRAVDSGFGAKRMLRSGARDKAQTRFGQGAANQEFGGWLNRLATTAGYGQNANAQGQQSGQQFAASAGSAIQDAAAARASGYVGSANAWSGGANNLARLAGSFEDENPWGSGYAPFYSSAAAAGY